MFPIVSLLLLAGSCLQLQSKETECGLSWKSQIRIPYAHPDAAALECDEKTEIDSHCGNRCELRCEHIGHTTVFLSKCPHVCDTPACKCKGGLYRNEEGECVPPERCPHGELTVASIWLISYKSKWMLECPDYELMNDCGKRCEKTCSLHNKKIVCPLTCETPACVCGPDLFRTRSGQCVQLKDCPEEGEVH